MSVAEEKIPVHPPPVEVFFVVNCPSLHIVPRNRLGAIRETTTATEGLFDFERVPSYCPGCGTIVTSTRQIPRLCFGPESSAACPSNITLTPPAPLTPPVSLTQPVSLEPRSPTTLPEVLHYEQSPKSSSARTQSDASQFSPRGPTPTVFEDPGVPNYRTKSSSLPEPVNFLDVIDREILDPRPERALPTPKSKASFFNLKWPSRGRRQNSKDSNKPKSTYSQDSSGSSLPKFLSFGFALSGKDLLIWKKDSQSLVRVELENNGGRLLNLGALLPGGGVTEGDLAINIRYVAEGSEWIAAIVSHNVFHTRRLSLLVLHASGLPEHSTLHPLDEQSDPRCLAISPDNSYVAIGFGNKVLLLHYQGADQQWLRVLHIPEFATASTVRFQALSFSADSSCLAVASQKRDMNRSEGDDVVYSSVWRCDPGANAPLKLWSCRMPTDGQGLTSIYFHPGLSLGVVTGLTATPYSLFLSPADQPAPPPPTTLTDFRLRGCRAAPAPGGGGSSVVYVLDARNRILRADLAAQSVRVVADLHTVRGALRPQEEPAALGVAPDGHTVRVFWRQGPGLWCVDVRERLAPQKRNLREIWLEAVGDG